MSQIKTPPLETVIQVAKNYASHDTRVIGEIRDGKYTQEQWAHYYYVNLTLNLSTSQREGKEAMEVVFRRRETLLPEAYKAAAKAFGIPVEEVKTDWDLVVLG